MILRRLRITTAAAALATVGLLAASLPAPGASSPVLDAPALTSAADGVRIVVQGAATNVERAIGELGGTVVAKLPFLGSLIADVPAGAVKAVEDVPGVTSVVADSQVDLQSGSPDSTTVVETQAHRTIGAHRVWAKGYDGSGVGIAVIDTGVSPIADLDGRIVGGLDLTPEQNGLDSYGHGTPIAWLAAGDGSASGGDYSGVAPGAHIVPVKIAGADGATEVARVLVAMDWVARHADELGIRVVNLSLGSAPAALDLVDAAAQRLWDLGLVVVVAGGNNGPDTMGTPAGNTHVITVGSTISNDTRRTSDDSLASWSATGVDADGVAKPDVVVPGQSLVVAGAPGSWAYENHPDGHLGDGYQRATGTSFSAGLISGAAALALQANPDWTPDEVLGQLIEGAKPIEGSVAPTPWLPTALQADSPVTANVGATAAPTASLDELGPVSPFLLAEWTGDLATAVTYGTGWYGTGWYGTGWYSTSWYGTGWYGTGWYGTGWYGTGWYGTGWYGTGWYGTGWYGTGWYGGSAAAGTGWYAGSAAAGTGWYAGSAAAGTGWYAGSAAAGTGWYAGSAAAGTGWY